MKKMPVNFILSVLAVIFFLMHSTIVLAEDPPPPLAEAWVVTPVPGKGAEFRTALAEHMAFRTEHGDPRAWQVYTPVLGDDLGRIAVRFCCFKWADQDSYEAWQDSAEKINAHFSEHIAPLAENWKHYFESIDWGNSHWNEDAGPYKYFAVTEFNLKPGHGQDFDAARDKMSQIALNQGWATADHSWLWTTTIGGKPQENIVVPHKNYASFDRDQEDFSSFLARHIGADESAELLKQFASASWSTDFQIWEHHAELSMSEED